MQLKLEINTTITSETNNMHMFAGAVCKVEWLGVTLLIGIDVGQSL